jgi:hypothetical protein
MSSTSFKELLCCDDLFIKSENQVYDIACEYIYRNSRLSDEEKREIMSCVRFTFLSLNRLRDIKDRVLRDDSWYVSKDTILDVSLIYVVVNAVGVMGTCIQNGVPIT